MDQLKTLEPLGFTLPGPAYIFGAVLFSLIGWAAYRYGKKSSLTPFKGLGIALMLYPYAITDTLMLYGVGVALCFGLYWYRK
ncbi:hypothetical protein PG1C_05880 [Rugosibacter aromaticivorans]|uniref:Uncharacterized protein n=1 Tax=Rugosibacter aromaticivorans TaxID=1565605 RepID=A0A0C5IZE7_9PROT|nr:hypothetical protein [Rugosibacter aromaticivorans]AJP48117.1 hypothetical protein PG1C_05880 [Rugosibacter aromaticivorans]TBR15945.1 MAG: hypothetical protein EPO43_02135 [Rugosibacter sp.]